MAKIESSTVSHISKAKLEPQLGVNNNSNKLEGGSGTTFKEVLQKVGEKLGLNNRSDLHAELVTLQKQAANGSNFSNKDLLLYQVKAGQMHIEVELVSKVAESMLATFRKLQQGQ